MEVFLSIVGGVVVFALAVFIYSRFVVKSWTLDSLEMLPDEEVVFEEDGVDVEQVGGQRPVVFMSCKIRITNQRIIIAQKVLLSDKMSVRAVISYLDAAGEGTDLKASMRSACIVASIPPSAMSKELDGDSDSVLAIPLGGGMVTSHQTFHLYSERIDEILKLVDPARGAR